MNPPSDEDEIRAWLSAVPDHLLLQEAGRRRRARLVNPSGGRPKVLRPCGGCGEPLGARELLQHHCNGRKKRASAKRGADVTVPPEV